MRLALKRRTQDTVYCIVYNTNPGGGGLVTVTIVAVDTAGNQSAPASITINMALP